MARFDYLPADKLSPDVAAMLDRMPALNIFRMLAHAPAVFGPFMRFGNSLLTRTKLDPILREMAIVRVGILSNAAYEVHQHDRISRDLGMAEDKIAGLRLGPDAVVFSQSERAILAFTDDLVANVRASDATLKAVQAFLSVEEIIELTLTIGFYVMVCRFLETFGVDIEEVEPQALNLSRPSP
jgi:alkylhydroperoxidase family enzyme